MVELSATSAEEIKNSIIITNLFYYGMTDDFLKENLIAFISDGASTRYARKKNWCKYKVAKYTPKFDCWHCLNHHLELAAHERN